MSEAPARKSTADSSSSRRREPIPGDVTARHRCRLSIAHPEGRMVRRVVAQIRPFPAGGDLTIGKRFINVRPATRRCVSHNSEATMKSVTGAAMTEMNRNYGAALAIVVALIALAALAATFAR